MAKVYCFEKFKIRQKIKELENTIEERKRYGNKNGFLWIDHFTLISLHKEIILLNKQLLSLENGPEFSENKKD